MDEDKEHFWLVRPPDSEGFCVPILFEEVARIYEEQAWKVERLPLSALGERDLRCLRVMRGMRRPSGRGRR